MQASIHNNRVFLFTVVNKMQWFIFGMVKHKCKNKKECSIFQDGKGLGIFIMSP